MLGREATTVFSASKCEGGLLPTPHLTLPVAQYHLGLFTDVMTPVGCCPSLPRNPLPSKASRENVTVLQCLVS